MSKPKAVNFELIEPNREPYKLLREVRYEWHGGDLWANSSADETKSAR